MPIWLTDAVGTPTESSALQMTVRLVIAFLCGCVIAAIYRWVRPSEKIMPTFPATLVLLAILCAMLPLVIGQNVAWAFGLVGALSIVRFRTVVEDTHDITFVIFAVLVGMAVGADQLVVAIVGMAVTGIAAFLVRPRQTGTGGFAGDARLSIRIGIGRDPEKLLGSIFDRLLSKAELTSGGTSKQGASLDLNYRVRLKPDAKPTELINQLNLIEGVQSVDLRQGR
ncbi:putative membrane protein [Rhodopirellula maiorica SM1]|uniref:Putative membrane protein n=1 Tax=Rhodopirellula maiorica SM1 TaxID=1265738 RepID=M5RUB0_9BACT|nr:DUF4956 domain-containing protein [Rhodopirellula maiorica]EMI17564.1 putative membrane protein [Rhodopirellula maiorica SM1]